MKHHLFIYLFVLFICSPGLIFSEDKPVFKAEITNKGKPKKKKKKKEKKEQASERDTKKLNNYLLYKKIFEEADGKRKLHDLSGKGKIVPVQCPVCQLGFKALDVEEQAIDRGMDRDFCKHSFKQSAYDYDIWMCPRCGYSNFKRLFNEFKIEGDEAKDFVEFSQKQMHRFFNEFSGMNVENLGFFLEQDNIPTVIKYAMMESLLPILELPKFEESMFWVQYAWVERQRLVAPITNNSLSSLIRIMNDQLNDFKKETGMTKISSDPMAMIEFFDYYEKNTTTNDEEKMLLSIFRAGQWDRLGYPARARYLLVQSSSLRLTDSALKTLSYKKRVVEHEFELMKKALIAFKRTLPHQKIEPKMRPYYIYLIGELSRRLGLFPDAMIWYSASEKMTTDENLVKWIKEQKELLPFKPMHHVDPDIIRLERELAKKTIDVYLKDLNESNQNKSEIEVSTISDWLFDLKSAVVKYKKENGTYPKTMPILRDIGYLNHNEALADKIEKFRFSPLYGGQDFLIVSKITFIDKKGKYWPAINSRSVLERLRQLPLYIKD